MPWPMVHLTIAHLVKQGRPSPSFVLGSIAPNAFRVRQGANEQMKWASHSCPSEGVLPRVRDIQLFHSAHADRSLGEEYNEYLLGYAAHLYADVRWAETVYKGIENYVQRFIVYRWYSQIRSFQSLYQRDVLQLEYILMDIHPETKDLLEALEIAPALSMGALVSMDEVDDYRFEILRKLEEPVKPRSLRFMDVERVEQFIQDTAEELSWLLPSWQAQTEYDQHAYQEVIHE
ncbi:hypothetical protein TCA2_0311 [Paenibacillus sp. TCA20]|uniref:Phospholipase C/D domain-containing protein n=1 Tax=Paenibacillus urinalis TaxID=521520 RepID=A0AAX3N469_9BACL|nr:MULTISPECIES: hypothetical protein [Paenibacillus]WDH84417.1 hypothetical protein PUW23_09485 [Paenibacillus urinalis]WDI04101.1 hypothetical protein PUW25_09180 [Paenibacillus urinalis]GAK38585.1 hypothetical protein TCA2_0311 [Paenibacillus sp. TCA20]